jgi:hypothetical protein
LFNFLEAQQPAGAADLSAATKRLATQAQRSGMAIVLSDFLLLDGYQTGSKPSGARL